MKGAADYVDDALNLKLADLKRRKDAIKQIGDPKLAASDFNYYYQRLFALQDPVQFPWGEHLRYVMRFITWEGHNGIKPEYRLVVQPPGTGKSNIVSKALASWMVGNHPDEPTVLATSTGALATARSIYLREMVASDPMWQTVFPGVKPYSTIWTTDKWALLRPGQTRFMSSDSTFNCTGAEGSIAGIRIKYAIVDDIHDVNNSRTEGERKRIKDWYFTQFVSRMSGMGGWLIMLANIWHADDLPSTLWGSGQYAVMHMRALYDNREVTVDVTMPEHMGDAGPAFADYCESPRENWTWNEKDRKLQLLIHKNGPALWPQHEGRRELEAKRRSMGTQRFYRVWNGERRTSQGSIYKAEWFNYWNPNDPPQFRFAQQIWDTTAEKGRRSDWTAAVMQYAGEDNNLYVADCFREKLESGTALPLAITCWYLQAWLDGVRVKKVMIERAAVARSTILRLARGWETDDFLRTCEQYLRYPDSVPVLVGMIRKIQSKRDQLPDVIKLPLKGIKLRRGGKMEVHEDASPWYESGSVFHNSEMALLGKLEDELTDYPTGQNDDLADADAIGITDHFGIQVARSTRERGNGYLLLDNLTEVMGRLPVTGPGERVRGF